MIVVALFTSSVALLAQSASERSMARPAVQRSGRISNQDYPAAALRDQAEGVSLLRLRVREDGRVTTCELAESSGHRALDNTACSLAQRRFRFNPAVDAAGRPTAGWQTIAVSWVLPAAAQPGAEPR
ncbi:MAG TPA: energy transducer TonB [Allosphingosinicella sp.]|jgi:protein TonB